MTSLEKLAERPEVDENAVKSIQDQIAEVNQQIAVLEAEKKRVTQKKGIVQGLGQQVQSPANVTADSASKKEVSFGVQM